MLGAVIGTGSRRATLIGGAHADEPVGPETLRLLIAAATFGPSLPCSRCSAGGGCGWFRT